MGYPAIQQQLSKNGFAVVDDLFNKDELEQLAIGIDSADKSKSTFSKTDDLFAIRQCFKELPDIKDIVFNKQLIDLINSIFGAGYFVVKSIYFDKPEKSNWFVAWHQDLTISVNKRIDMPGFSSWTVKQHQFAVQPPINILEDIFTVRIHLDDTDENNGALKVVPGSHLNGVYRPENIDWLEEREVSCNVPRGGVMLMKPLLLHASNRTSNHKRRRVLHIEFSQIELPPVLSWAERMAVNLS